MRRSRRRPPPARRRAGVGHQCRFRRHPRQRTTPSASASSAASAGLPGRSVASVVAMSSNSGDETDWRGKYEELSERYKRACPAGRATRCAGFVPAQKVKSVYLGRFCATEIAEVQAKVKEKLTWLMAENKALKAKAEEEQGALSHHRPIAASCSPARRSVARTGPLTPQSPSARSSREWRATRAPAASGARLQGENAETK